MRVRPFLRENKDFHPDYLMSVFSYIIVRKEHTGEVVSEWHAAESEDGLVGYPWRGRASSRQLATKPRGWRQPRQARSLSVCAGHPGHVDGRRADG
jgi:hypothetical protein